MVIVIGSRALNEHIKLDRKMHDWDLIVNQKEYDHYKTEWKRYKVKETNYSTIYDVQGVIWEIRNPKTLDPTDELLLSTQPDVSNGWKIVVNKWVTSFAYVPPIQILYDIKKATTLCIDEPKHEYDLKLMELQYPQLEQNSAFFKQRLKETQERVSKSNKTKYDFFHKYHIPEYIQHDRLHDMFADLLDLNMPTYERITVADTDISEELFNKLTHEQKISLMVEEGLVLNLERWFIPQMIENGINYRLVDSFYNNNEAMPTYLILKHVCITGLRGEAEYITNFSRNNFFEIEKEWIKAKEKIKMKKDFPQWFFQELFDLRKKYKNNEKVGVV